MSRSPSLRTDSSAPPFRRLLVANRGEIALRVIRACRELGISPIAVHSDADANALHVRAADRSERIGPAPAGESYLSIGAILEAARSSGAEAIHPGYGFLSENAAFARAVEEAGLVFVGPPPSVLEALGNKLEARRSAAAVGVPIVPGTTVALEDDVSAVEEIGYPVMLKAAAGGGGRGMRRVDEAGQLSEAMAAARREAAAAFGDGTIYVERMVAPARHVEVQLLGDRHGGLAILGERECSIQRRHQKLVEESPSPAVDDHIREALFDSARRVAATVDFHNAATVEFLLDTYANHFFLEMNTRLQVEHGVSELVTGIDLVAWQIRVAAGERLPLDVLQAPRRGHAIEVRLYAEDPYDGFRPTAGRVGVWRMPDGPGTRVDAGIEADTDLPPEYDPLLTKLLVHAADRPAAVDRLRRALDETLIGGVQTDAGFLRWLVDDDAFAAGDYDTSLVAERWRTGPALTAEERSLAGLAALEARRAAVASTTAPATAPIGSAWGERARREALRG
ncbi:MAG: biotin carboxylase N-terminal domain-containing protein [Candidatus Limnocylindria bacterium]